MKLKKSESIGLQFIVVLVVVIAFAMIYFFWLKDFRITGENLSDYTICKNSNLENAKGKLKADNLAYQERRGNKCKTEYGVVVPEGQELNVIARNLAGCWDQYLEGQEELFKRGEGFLRPEDNMFCAICSVLEFEDNDNEITDLTSYLMETPVPFKKELKYYEYLNRVVVRKESVEEVKNAEVAGQFGIVDTSVPQAVIFLEGKDVNPGSLTGLASIETAAVGVAVGATVSGALIVTGAGLCAGVVTCTIGAAFIIAGFATAGYMTGSTYNPDLDSRVLLWPYENNALDRLQCSVLQGQDFLELRKTVN
tara:strand:+ start:1343 stop:2269 length:927 start_codon:yes stop_codon:yes gene_type:complete